ncbi:MAG TPA: hypothetical protein VHB98_05020 [Chloroflexota bacterium]|nr:hypothetical protein [Chloroflexota bacterium]
MADRFGEPQPLDQPVPAPGWAPFETAAPAGLAHRVYHTSQRQQGTALQARHQGVTHHPHAQTLAGLHHLAHPHQAAAQRHRQSSSHQAAEQPLKHLAKTHARLAARLGLQKVELGVITALDAAHNTVSVRLYGSQTNVIGPIPLGLGLAGAAAVGVAALVVLLDQSNPTDALVVGLYNGQLPPFAQRGRVSVPMVAAQQAVTVTFAVPYANALDAVVATTDNPSYLVAVGTETAGSFVATLERRDGGQQLQAGSAGVAVAPGSTSALQVVTFPVAFAVTRSFVAVSELQNWTVSVASVTAGSAQVIVQAVNGVTGPATVTVSWLAMGDPQINDLVTFDWIAMGR